ncbi:MAG TPA: ferritin family protein [Kofleriaceae bacterium]|nr:ferritin family protein [Kofleriaceae bacterium]
MQIEKFIKHSRRVEVDDLDWDEAARVGLSGDEPFILSYFTDIEGQTVFYFRELLNTHAARNPDVVAFMTTWNYEEYFHAESLAKVLEVCGHGLGGDRRTAVRDGATTMARIENLVQLSLSRLLPDGFLALFMTWGASQELLTSRCYERLEETTRNPVLRELARRIAKQERRHFAYYFNSARHYLGASRVGQRLTRTFYERFWTPVGSGVKTRSEVYRLVDALFPGTVIDEVMGDIASRISTLPGMAGAAAPLRFADRVWRNRAANNPLLARSRPAGASAQPQSA